MHLRSNTNRNRSGSILNAAIEQLESRQMMAHTPNVPLGTNGWSDFTFDPSKGKKIYVSKQTSANDSNNGLTPDTAVRSVSRARELVQDGKADWILFRRGDTWTEGLGNWSWGGHSSGSPMIISYFGYYNDPAEEDPVYFDLDSFPATTTGLGILERPQFNTGISDGIQLSGSFDHFAMVGLSFTPHTYDGKNSKGVTGFRAQLNATDILVEDCKFTGYKDGLAVANPGAVVTDFTLRRSQILDSYNAGGAHAQGLYVSGAGIDITIEENVFDHNGWKEGVSGADKTVFNHNMYINTGATDVLIRGNVSTRGSLRGTLLRSGGDVYDNLYVQNAVAVQVGNKSSEVKGNVILEGVDLPSLASGVGIDVAFSMDGVAIENNIVAHDQSAYTYNLSGINVNGGTKNATVKNNIVYDWRRTFINGASGGTSLVQGNVFEDFDGYHPVVKVTNGGDTDYRNNTYYVPNTAQYLPPKTERERAFQDGNTRMSFSQWTSSHDDTGSTMGTLKTFVDPNRNMGSYNASLGGAATFNAWISTQRAQSRSTDWYKPGLGNSLPKYTAASAIKHIRDGFSDGTNNPPPTVTPQTVNVTATDSQAAELGPNTGTFTLERTGSATQLQSALQVNFEFSGSATNAVDYTATGSATFGANSTTTVITINPLPANGLGDGISEGDETVRFNIRAANSSTNPAYVSGDNPSATITIADSLASVNVQAPISEASEIGPVPGQFTLTRSGTTAAPLTVDILFSGSALNPDDYTISTTAPFTGNQITFSPGESSIDITIIPVADNVLEGPLDANDQPTQGDETVGLSLLPSTAPIPAYAQGISTGATITIFDGEAPPPGGGGGDNPPPLGPGLYEAFINGQDKFVPTAVFTPQTDLDDITELVQDGVYGPVAYDQVDSRPGFNFSGSPHAGVNANFFTTIWTGQIEAQYEETYTLYLSMDADARGEVWIRDDTDVWTKVVDSGHRHRPGDANDDGRVNALDFNALASNFGTTGKVWRDGDFTGPGNTTDGVVNSLDFTVLASNFNTPDPRKPQEITGDTPTSVKDLAPRGTIDFQAGARYDVVIMYSDKISTAKVRFLWSSDSRPTQEVPLDRLYASEQATTPVAPGPAVPSSALGGLVESDLFSDTIIEEGDPSVLAA